MKKGSLGGWEEPKGQMVALPHTMRSGSHTDLRDRQCYGHGHTDKEGRQQNLRAEGFRVSASTVEAFHQEPMELPHLQPPALQLAAALAYPSQGLHVGLCAERQGSAASTMSPFWTLPNLPGCFHLVS